MNQKIDCWIVSLTWKCFNFYVIRTQFTNTTIRDLSTKEFSFDDNVVCCFIHEYDDSWFFSKRICRLSWKILNNFVVFKERTSLIWRSYFIYSLFRRTIYSKQKFEKMSINFAKFKTRNRVLKTMNYRHCWLNWRFRVKDEIVTNLIVSKTKSSQIEQISCLFIRWSFVNVKFTSFVTMKIKYNVRRRVRINKL